MITGHNTDVEYAGRVYHVQTEDKGESNPVIETLVYSRGAILDSRRHSYAEAIKNGPDERIVLRLMEQQHRRMVREVRNGRYDPEGPKPFGYNIISNRTLDEVALEWLVADRGGQGLRIDLSEGETFFEGSQCTVALAIRSVSDSAPVAGATVWVRLFDPRTTPTKLFQGSTDEEGRVSAPIAIPDLGGTQGALVFHVKHGDRAAELTRPILPSV
jgi:hypothetical protein